MEVNVSTEETERDLERYVNSPMENTSSKVKNNQETNSKTSDDLKETSSILLQHSNAGITTYLNKKTQDESEDFQTTISGEVKIPNDNSQTREKNEFYKNDENDEDFNDTYKVKYEKNNDLSSNPLQKELKIEQKRNTNEGIPYENFQKQKTKIKVYNEKNEKYFDLSRYSLENLHKIEQTSNIDKEIANENFQTTEFNDNIEENDYLPLNCSFPNVINNEQNANTDENEMKFSLDDQKNYFERQTPFEKETPSFDQLALHKNITKNRGWIHRVCTPNVFVSSYKKFKPFEKVASLPYDSTYIKQIENIGIKRVTNLESWSLASINESLNTLMIGPKKAGKTTSYLLPLVHRVLTEDLSYLPQGNSPHLLILVPTWSLGYEVYELLEDLVNHSKVRILQIYGDGKEKEKYCHLLNGCDILITTPPSYIRMRMYNILINCKRLLSLVFEEAHLLIDRFPKEIEAIIKECSFIKTRHIQFIVCSEIWENKLDLFFNQINYPRTVIISSPMEAFLFAGVPIKINLTNQDEKINQVIKIIEQKKRYRKTLVVCNTKSQLEELVLGIKPKFFYLLQAHESTFHTDLHDIYDAWCNDNDCLLICTDAVLPSLAIRDVQCLIHYSLPPHSKTQFSDRFATFLDHLSPYFGWSQDLESHLIIDETVTNQISHLISFIRRLEIEVHPEFESRSLKIQQNTENKKYGEILCPVLKSFGQCWDEMSCFFRHVILADFDKPAEGVPQSGHVTLHLLDVQKDCSLSARILKHTLPDGSLNRKINRFAFLDLSMKLSLYCNTPLKREKAPEAGDVWAYKDKQGCPKRVKILKIEEYDAFVYFLDEASTETIDIRYLIPLSKDLAMVPAQAVQIFMCNLLPCDLDESWNICIIHRVFQLLKLSLEPSYELVGKINLALGHSLWLEPIEVKKYLPITKTWSIDFVLRNTLLFHNFAKNNPNHIERLRRISVEAGLEIPQLEPRQIKTIRDKASWAFLPSNEWIEIQIINVKNPDFFFVRQVKFIENVKKLNKELQKQIIRKPKILEEGAFVGVRPDQSQPWKRGKILTVLNKIHAEVLTIDEGEQFITTIGNITKIPDKLHDRLPCQIIEASLMGIESTLPGSWSKDTISTLKKFSKSNDHLVSLYAQVCEKKPTCQLTGGNHYRLVIMENLVINTSSINVRLVAQNLAKFIESEKDYILNMQKTNSQQDSEDLISNKETEIWTEFQTMKITPEANSKTFFSPPKRKIEKIARDDIFENDDQEGFEFNIDNPADFIKNAVGKSFEKDLGIGLLELANFYNSKNKQIENTNEAFNENQDTYEDIPIVEEVLQHENSLEPTSQIDYPNYQEYSDNGIILDNAVDPTPENDYPDFQQYSPDNAISLENDVDVNAESHYDSQQYSNNSRLDNAEMDSDEQHNKELEEQELRYKEEEEQLHKEFYASLWDDPRDKKMPKLRERFPTLKALTTWEQDIYFIYLKIHITGLENYYMCVNLDEFRFIARNPLDKSNDLTQLYWVDFWLFGPVFLHTHEKSGFYVSIKLQKLVGDIWPRLLRSEEKSHWIKRGTDLVGNQTYVEEAMEVMHSVSLEPPVETQFFTNVPTIEDECQRDKSDEESESEDEETLLKELITHHDPYDPFS